MPVILSSSQTVLMSDAAGLASLTPSAGSVSGAVEIAIQASAGISALQNFELESAWIATATGGSSRGGSATIANRNREKIRVIFRDAGHDRAAGARPGNGERLRGRAKPE